MPDTSVMQETVVVTHTDGSGVPDYTIKLTFAYHKEEGQWVGICTELGTATCDEMLEQTKADLKDAVELQLNEIDRISDVKGYLTDNNVEIVPAKLPEQAGFVIS